MIRPQTRNRASSANTKWPPVLASGFYCYRAAGCITPVQLDHHDLPLARLISHALVRVLRAAQWSPSRGLVLPARWWWSAPIQWKISLDGHLFRGAPRNDKTGARACQGRVQTATSCSCLRYLLILEVTTFMRPLPAGKQAGRSDTCRAQFHWEFPCPKVSLHHTAHLNEFPCLSGVALLVRQ